ncbi:uncharacterized protein [Montipora capricornis]|uniref:uncharacterized protein isoform X1 n=1 Tax=Montipora capricornis TaxID=246305 RepID=UPI0035F1336B
MDSGVFFSFSSFLLLIISALLSIYLVTCLLPRGKIDIKGKYVLITGCDTGFGRATAIKLDKMGACVLATCLTKEGEHSLKSEASDELKTFQLDVTNSKQIKDVYEEIKKDVSPGSTSISLELAIAILTILFFHMNTKKKYEDVFEDAHLQLGVPVEWISSNEKHGIYCEESTTPINRHQGHNENSDSLMEKNSIDEAAFDNEGLLNSEEKDIFTLRQKFVDRILEPDEELYEIIRSTDCITLARNIEDFRCPGFYNNELGDFVMKVASPILRIPTVIVSSNEAAHCIPFVPPGPILKEPLYVAFTSYGPGHYDSTHPVTVVDERNETNASTLQSSFCARGRKSAGMGSNCSIAETSKCSCVGKGTRCTRRCRCRGCQNKQETSKNETDRRRSKGVVAG